jgi:signal recognition particle GTPase
MFENLSGRLSKTVKKLRGQARLTEDNIQEALRDVRMALLEADVALPVVRELPGLSNFNVSSWNALAAPGKTPPAVVSRLNAEVMKVLADPATVQRLAESNVQAQSSTLGQLAQLLDGDINRWSAVIQKAGIAQQ